MKFIVSSGALLKQLQVLGGLISTNTNIAIIENFLFDIQGNKLSISSSDLETTMRSSIAINSEESGKVALPAKMLLETLKSLPEQPVTFIVNSDKSAVEISSDYGKYTIGCFDGDEFPELPEVEEPGKLNLPADKLLTAIQKTVFATGNDEMRLIMTGVFAQFTPEHVTFVATDAHKLVRYRVLDVQSDSTAELILPKKPLNLLKGILASADTDVTVYYSEKNVRFEFDEVVLVCRLIEGKYPNYEAVIPTNNPSNLIIDRASFLSSVRRVSIFSNKSTNQVRLKITGTEIHISAEDLDFANKAAERLNCNFEGEDITIGFNAKFLMEMIANLESKDIHMELSAPNRAGLLFPTDGMEENEELLMLVMPVMVSQA
jgi:DNA polymerase-3 subunit beta